MKLYEITVMTDSGYSLHILMAAPNARAAMDDVNKVLTATMKQAFTIEKVVPVSVNESREDSTPGVLPDCLKDGHVLDATGHCKNCGMDLK